MDLILPGFGCSWLWNPVRLAPPGLHPRGARRGVLPFACVLLDKQENATRCPQRSESLGFVSFRYIGWPTFRARSVGAARPPHLPPSDQNHPIHDC